MLPTSWALVLLSPLGRPGRMMIRTYLTPSYSFQTGILGIGYLLVYIYIYAIYIYIHTPFARLRRVPILHWYPFYLGVNKWGNLVPALLWFWQPQYRGLTN